MIRLLLRFLSNFANQEQVIERLANSRPIRRSAQMIAYFYHRGNASLKESAGGFGPLSGRLLGFKQRFVREFREELKEAKRKLGK